MIRAKCKRVEKRLRFDKSYLYRLVDVPRFELGASTMPR